MNLEKILLHIINELEMADSQALKVDEVLLKLKTVNEFQTNASFRNVGNYVFHCLIEEKSSYQHCISTLKSLLPTSFDLLTEQREARDGFDQKYGTNTAQIISQVQLCDEISAERIIHSSRYHPTPVRSMQQIFESFAENNLNFSEFIFVDIGSGLGRNLLLATSFPFKKILGVEISAELSSTAIENVKIFNNTNAQNHQIDFFIDDVCNFQFESENYILYFWEPFSDAIFSHFLSNIQKAFIGKQKTIYLVFLGNVFKTLKTSSDFELVDVFNTDDMATDQEPFVVSVWINS